MSTSPVRKDAEIVSNLNRKAALDYALKTAEASRNITQDVNMLAFDIISAARKFEAWLDGKEPDP